MNSGPTHWRCSRLELKRWLSKLTIDNVYVIRMNSVASTLRCSYLSHSLVTRSKLSSTPVDASLCCRVRRETETMLRTSSENRHDTLDSGIEKTPRSQYKENNVQDARSCMISGRMRSRSTIAPSDSTSRRKIIQRVRAFRFCSCFLRIKSSTATTIPLHSVWVTMATYLRGREG